MQRAVLEQEDSERETTLIQHSRWQGLDAMDTRPRGLRAHSPPTPTHCLSERVLTLMLPVLRCTVA